MDAVIEKWEEILQTVKSEYEVTDVPFNTWLKPLKVYEVDGKLITVVVPSEQAAIGVNYISKRYKIPLQVTICVLTGMEECEVRFVLEKDLPKKTEKNTSYDKQVQDTRYEEAHLNPKYTFDTFVVGSNNKFAQAAALAVAESPGDTYNPLFIYGGAGLGKTHLMHSIAHFILEHDENSRVLYVTSEQFSNTLISVLMRKDPIDDFRKQYRGVDVLLLDDVQFLAGKGRCLEEFFHTFNDLYDAGKQIVLSSDKPPHEIVEFEERVRSRFAWGLTVDIALPDYETRIAFLRKRAETEHLLQIENGALEYIASEDGLNFRQLDGRFNRVTAYASLMGQPITLQLAEAALKDYTAAQKKRALTPRNIIQIVCSQFDITYDEIVGKRRSRDIAVPRQVAMYLVRTLTDHSFPKIGELFGGRHYSTVMHDVEKVAQEVKTNSETKEMVEDLIAQINES